MKRVFFRQVLSVRTFRAALMNVSVYGGAIVVATRDKAPWLEYKRLHATPCARVYIKTPIKDTVSGCTWLLVDSKLPKRKVVRNWLERCNKAPADICDKGANISLVNHDLEGQIPRHEILEAPF